MRKTREQYKAEGYTEVEASETHEAYTQPIDSTNPEQLPFDAFVQLQEIQMYCTGDHPDEGEDVDINAVEVICMLYTRTDGGTTALGWQFKEARKLDAFINLLIGHRNKAWEDAPKVDPNFQLPTEENKDDGSKEN